MPAGNADICAYITILYCNITANHQSVAELLVLAAHDESTT